MFTCFFDYCNVIFIVMYMIKKKWKVDLIVLDKNKN